MAGLRGDGKGPDDARDLIRGFFEHLLQNNLLQAADRARGRVRSFLLACMKNYLSHERDRDAALKRGGGATTISLDDDAEGRFLREGAELEPDALDLRAEKTLDLGNRGRVHLLVDAFNITNNDIILGQEQRINSGLNGRITEVLQGRTIRFGLRLVLR